ncbi:uncharacterized protein LOC127283728 [Leptopilina boulardi]|uniref:uncharacterized protein LOC127283728 n=1 Tax=Leptopilina boulardi TaxID=63433 RepID=UPI0021F61780|nr:uncharacterized protein LOC127283728 [Leptopilina boulardi]
MSGDTKVSEFQFDIDMLDNNNSMTECDKNLNVSISNTKKPRNFQPRIKSFLDIISEQEKSDLNRLVAKLFLGCNVDPKVADSDYFKMCIKSLRPGYTPPSSNEISTTLLNKCYENLEKQKKDFNNNPGILYIITANENNLKSVISLIRHSDFEISFLKSCLMRTTTTGEEYDRELNKNVLAHNDVYSFYLKHLDKLKHLYIVSKFKFPQAISKHFFIFFIDNRKI